MVRTGNSVLTAGHELPFAGGRKGYLIGVGSFTPTDVTARRWKPCWRACDARPTTS